MYWRNCGSYTLYLMSASTTMWVLHLFGCWSGFKIVPNALGEYIIIYVLPLSLFTENSNSERSIQGIFSQRYIFNTDSKRKMLKCLHKAFSHRVPSFEKYTPFKVYQSFPIVEISEMLSTMDKSLRKDED